MANTYTSKSPYYKTSLSKGYLDVATFRNITSRADDPLYIVDAKYENRPDLLAYDLYNDSNLWWVFVVRNKDTIKDPVYDLVAGVQIYLPKLSNIQAELGI
jgi:hypothetical protein